MDEAIQGLAQLVAAGVDIWKEYEAGNKTDSVVAKFRGSFWNCYLPLASNSLSVEAGVKEAKIVSTIGRNEDTAGDSSVRLVRTRHNVRREHTTP